MTEASPEKEGGAHRMDKPRIIKLPMMLRLACGAQRNGPELVCLGPELLSSVKVDAGTGYQRSQYVEVAI